MEAVLSLQKKGNLIHSNEFIQFSINGGTNE